MAAATTTRRRAKAKPAPEPVEVEEIDELEEDEVEEVEEDDEEPAPKRPAAKKKTSAKTDEKSAKKSPRTEVTNGTNWLAEHVNKTLGTSYKPYDLRVLLRKMAKNDELEREVGSDRSRYDFAGPKDPIVLAVIKKLKAGELEKDKKEKLTSLKGRNKAAAKSKVADDDEVGDELEEDVDELDDSDE